jgi:phage-related minor tail protein
MALNVGAAFKISASVDGQAQLDRLNTSLQNVGKNGDVSAGQIKSAMRSLPAQFTDIATQLAGGQSPFMILLQQGGQIKDQFGGVGNALRGIGSLITPAAVAFGGLAAAVGAFSFAAIQGYQESIALQRAIALTGNYAGITADQFDSAAKRIQAASGSTIGAARELMMSAVGSGQFGPQSIDAVTNAMARLQKLSGQSSEEILKVFSGMSRGVANWAAEANKSYNFLDAAQYRYLRSLEDQGQKEMAMAEAARMLDAALQQRTVQLGYIETAWNKVKVAASSAWNSMMGLGRDETPQQKMAALQEELARVEASAERAKRNPQDHLRNSFYTKTIQNLKDQIDNLNEVVRLENRSVSMASTRAAENRKAVEAEKKAGEERRKTISEFDRLKTGYEDQIAKVGDLSAAEELLKMIQLGRYKDLSAQQRDELVRLAKELDQKKTAHEQEREAASLREKTARQEASDAEARERRLDATRQKWIDLIDPVEKYRRELWEIRDLEDRGLLSPEQAASAENKVREKIDELGRLKETGKDTFSELESAIRRFGEEATNTFVDFVFGGKASFKDLITSVLKDLARLVIQMQVMKPLFESIKGGFGGSGNIFGSIKGFFGFANGGVMTSSGSMPLKAYSSGGIANSPQLALFGEGRMPEAYVPLPDGRSIPVTMNGGSGGAPVNVNVVVNAQTGQTDSNDQGTFGRLGAAIGAAVRQEIINQKRPGGLLAAA